MPRRMRQRIKTHPEQVTYFAQAMKKGLWVVAWGPGVPVPVLMRVGKGNDGQLACTGLLVGFDFDYPTQQILSGSKVELTARRLHDVKLGELLDAIAADPFYAKALGEVPKVRPGRRRRPGSHIAEDDKEHEAREAWELYTAERGRRRGSPYKAMAQTLGVSETTAWRRVQRAKEMGLDQEQTRR